MSKMNITYILAVFAIVNSVAVQAQGIIFTRQINNNDNLMMIDENGSIESLTNQPRKDSSPMISPDGKLVVFTSERVGWWKIWTMNLLTKETKQLTHNGSADYSPSWSPDSKTILFTSTRDGNQEIYLMDKDGDNKRNITKTQMDEVMPFWANDNYVYFSTQVSEYYQVMKCKPDGSDRQQVTFSKGDKLMAQPSPDMSKLLFYGNADGNMEIYVYDFKSKEEKRLTNHPLLDMRPRWSPDSKKIVFERGNKGNNHHIYLMNVDGSNVIQLTSEGYNYGPSFLPKYGNQ